MEQFFEMLKYRRPMDSDTELEFIYKFLAPLGVEMDDAGNVYKRIGESNILWSSHTDTVHHSDGYQEIKVTDTRVMLAEGSGSNCLGADCGTGVYIMTEMIKANKPGLYVFHRGEEHGSHGSRHIAKEKTLLEGIEMAIAFDRHSNNSIITYQGGRCCSEEFSQSVSVQLPYLKSDPGGVFTDTANYDHIVPECTNLSVGYKGHHSPLEFQDLIYLDRFINDMIALDTSKLVVARDPKKAAVFTGTSGIDWSGYGLPEDFGRKEADDDNSYAQFSWFADDDNADLSETEKLAHLIRNNPFDAASLMMAYGITAAEFEEHCYATTGY
jgi:hypothetical protein